MCIFLAIMAKLFLFCTRLSLCFQVIKAQHQFAFPPLYIALKILKPILAVGAREMSLFRQLYRPILAGIIQFRRFSQSLLCGCLLIPLAYRAGTEGSVPTRKGSIYQPLSSPPRNWREESIKAAAAGWAGAQVWTRVSTNEALPAGPTAPPPHPQLHTSTPEKVQYLFSFQTERKNT